MATTTNYSWTTPDDTDLVKDGAAAIRTLGSSADTTVKDLNPGTTAGDIDYYTSSTAKARVAIGTAGQVLQVNSGATAPEWAAFAGGGKVLQVVNQLYQTVTSSSSGTFADTGITLNITPTSATSKVLVLINVQGVEKSAANAGNAVDFQILRGATVIGGVDAINFTNSSLKLINSYSCTILDSPATTSATTYKLQFRNDAGNVASVTINAGGLNDSSTITLMEIGA
jgi:hypothetical protein